MKEQVLSDKQRRDSHHLNGEAVDGLLAYTYILYLLFGYKHIRGYKE